MSKPNTASDGMSEELRAILAARNKKMNAAKRRTLPPALRKIAVAQARRYWEPRTAAPPSTA